MTEQEHLAQAEFYGEYKGERYTAYPAILFDRKVWYADVEDNSEIPHVQGNSMEEAILKLKPYINLYKREKENSL